jgi:predicted transglutaminase-like cysteine proteinase
MTSLIKLNQRFKYKLDGKHDSWQVLDVDKPGELLGDCEDYALTVLFILSNHNWLTFWWNLISRKAKICYCKPNGVGHAVLRFNGQYIDNIQQTWCTKKKLQDKNYNLHWRGYGLYIPYQVAIKMLIGWAIRKRQ